MQEIVPGYNLDNADSVVTGQFKITPTVTLHKILKIRNNIEWQLGYEKQIVACYQHFLYL
jgi:hypothetical protein